MLEKTRLTAEQLAENFADLHPPYSSDEAVAEAARCLYCYDAPCTRACPTDIDVPRFIRQVLHENPLGAAETILSANILGGSCARACPTEVLCEGACVDRTLLKSPVDIGRLQRFATDHAAEKGVRFFEPGTDSGRSVAVIGSGPAGLSCAHELRKAGHAVTIYEARDILGGLNTLGIAAYKISTAFSLSEVAQVLEMGIDVRLNEHINADRLADLLSSYDAVFLGIGLGPTARLDLPGEDLDGVTEALDFIFQTHTGPLTECEVGKHVVVIGAGNTAIDVATEAVRLGAERVTIVYRRTAEDMSAFAYEYDLAKADGVHFMWQVQPTRFIQKDGHLAGVRLQKIIPGEQGRASGLVLVEGSDIDLACDMVVKALGQTHLLDLLKGINGISVARGRLVIDPLTGETGVPGLFAGGDCISKGAEIVNAVQEGKIAAFGIDQYLSD